MSKYLPIIISEINFVSCFSDCTEWKLYKSIVFCNVKQGTNEIAQTCCKLYSWMSVGRKVVLIIVVSESKLLVMFVTVDGENT
jgi:hypothetical protein